MNEDAVTDQHSLWHQSDVLQTPLSDTWTTHILKSTLTNSSAAKLNYLGNTHPPKKKKGIYSIIICLQLNPEPQITPIIWLYSQYKKSIPSAQASHSQYCKG